ncbi:hypothetical protein GKC56_06785 [Neisseriaceae bacterium PsAf]|nr:hypothetical protein [Neisseriaceae bacterium PsAf]
MDIRTPQEFESVHIPQSINIPLDQIDQLQKFDDDSVVLFCRSGVRTTNNQSVFEKFTQAENLYIIEHGIIEWIQMGYPVE